MDAEQIADLPEARAYAEWLNAQAAAREAVIEAARNVILKREGTFGMRDRNVTQELRDALAELDGLNPPAALDQTREVDVSAYLADQAHGWD